MLFHFCQLNFHFLIVYFLRLMCSLNVHETVKARHQILSWLLCGSMSWGVTVAFLFLSPAQSVSLLPGVYPTAADSHSKNHRYVWLLVEMGHVLWLVLLSSRLTSCFCPRWPLPPWQCVVLVRVHPDLRLQCSLGSPSVRTQQDSQRHLVPG